MDDQELFDAVKEQLELKGVEHSDEYVILIIDASRKLWCDIQEVTKIMQEAIIIITTAIGPVIESLGQTLKELSDAFEEIMLRRTDDELFEYGTGIKHKLKLAYVDQSTELYYKRHHGYRKGNLKIMPYNYRG